MFGNDNAFASTRRTFINTIAAAGGAALFGRLGITPALVVEAAGKAESGVPQRWSTSYMVRARQARSRALGLAI